MAQLFKGHVVDDGHYPMPSVRTAPAAAARAGRDEGASIDPADLKRAAGDLEKIVSMVGALAPTVAQMTDSVRTNAQQQGYSDGIARAQAEVQQQLVDAITALTDAQRQRHEIAQRNDAALAELAMKIARKVIGAHLDADPMLVARIVRETIRDLEPTTALDVHVHPEDLPAVEASRSDLERLVAGGSGRITLTADPTVDRGGCILISPVGEVDARIETKLAVLQTAFAAQRRELAEGP